MTVVAGAEAHLEDVVVTVAAVVAVEVPALVPRAERRWSW